MGAQFSEEFLLGYRAGHRDGFADATLLMRDAVTQAAQASAVGRRQAQLNRLLSSETLVPNDGQAVEEEGRRAPSGRP